jgi:hypothetical protein
LILQCEEPVDKISPTACHLCNEWEANLLDSNRDGKRAFLNEEKKVESYRTPAQFRRQLGRYVEQLALLALSIDEVEEAEDQSDSQSDDNESAQSVNEQIKDIDSVLEEALKDLKDQQYPDHPAFVNEPRKAIVNAHQNAQAASGEQTDAEPILSKEDNTLVINLASRLMNQASEEQKKQPRTSLQARMEPEIFQKYISQGQDLLFLYFRNQALNRLRAQKKEKARLAQAEQFAMAQQPRNIPVEAPPMQ